MLHDELSHYISHAFSNTEFVLQSKPVSESTFQTFDFRDFVAFRVLCFFKLILFLNFLPNRALRNIMLFHIDERNTTLFFQFAFFDIFIMTIYIHFQYFFCVIGS